MAEGVLGRIVDHKRAELRQRFDGIALDALRSAATPTRRSLRAAMAQPGGRFILEVKKSSPSLGAIAAFADAREIARGYRGVADALSVLTDARFFGGSLDDLRAARAEFDGPILAKDFFVDPRQVADARIAGADAILIMLSVLSDGEARQLIEEAARFGMDALVEVHDEREMRRALTLGAPLIGINNRDLRDLSIDLSTTERLAPLAHNCTLISESGVTGRSEVARLAPLVDGFLIGSSLMRSGNPAQAARALIFGRVKLCGLRCGADLDAARPAAFAGFVFAPDSPRQVAIDDSVPLAGTARSAGMLPVGIFRDSSIEDVVSAARLLGLHAVQLHGSESTDEIVALRRQLPNETEIWTAVGVGSTVPPSRGGDRTLFDHGHGGSGRSFDWAVLSGHCALDRAILAGGIGPSNAREARSVGAYAIDVGSALDETPGRKCARRTAGLFDALRPDSRRGFVPCV